MTVRTAGWSRIPAMAANAALKAVAVVLAEYCGYSGSSRMRSHPWAFSVFSLSRMGGGGGLKRSGRPEGRPSSGSSCVLGYLFLPLALPLPEPVSVRVSTAPPEFEPLPVPFSSSTQVPPAGQD